MKVNLVTYCRSCRRYLAATATQCSKCQGRIPAKGRRYWLDYRQGKRRRYDPTQASTLTEARAAARAKEQELAGMAVTERELRTVEDLAVWYFTRPRVVAKRSRARDEFAWARLEDGLGKTTLLRKITPDTLTAYQSARLAMPTYKGDPPAPATVNRELEIFRAALRMATKARRYAGFNPVDGVDMLPEVRRRRGVTEMEYQAVLAAARNDSGADYLVPFIVLGRYTGMRAGEIRDLTWGEVDLDGACIRLHALDADGKPRTKEGRGKLIPLRIRDPRTGEVYDQALRALQHLPRGTPAAPVITCRGGRAINYLRAWHRALKDAGLVGIRFHDLRAAFINWIEGELGLSSELSMAITGHTTRDAHAHYRAVSEREVLALVGG